MTRKTIVAGLGLLLAAQHSHHQYSQSEEQTDQLLSDIKSTASLLRSDISTLDFFMRADGFRTQSAIVEVYEGRIHALRDQTARLEEASRKKEECRKGPDDAGGGAAFSYKRAECRRRAIENPGTATSERSVPVYQIDDRHAGAHFKVRHMMISWVSGAFSRVTGCVAFDPMNLAESHIEATIDAATVSTRDPQRDQHLKSADFLDVGRYPTIRFRSTKILSAGEHSYNVDGDLTIRGVTRDVMLRVESLTPEIKDPDGFLRRGARASTQIERRDFGLIWNAVLESGGFVVGDEVEITIDVELIRQT